MLFIVTGIAALTIAGLLSIMIQKRKDGKGRALCREKRLIDIHCHILPGVDDGANDLEETMEMLEMACSSGISSIIATPHYKNRTKEETEELKKVFQEVKKEVKKYFPNFQLYLGNEIYYTEDTLNDLIEGRALTLAGSRYVLIEFLPSAMFSQILNAVRTLKTAGYLPILAHLERYECLLDEKGEAYLNDLKKAGAYFQVNGRTFKRKTERKWCKKYMKNYSIDFVATDGHNRKDRTPKMNFAAGWITRKFGYKTAEKLFVTNPQKILEGRKREE